MILYISWRDLIERNDPIWREGIKRLASFQAGERGESLIQHQITPSGNNHYLRSWLSQKPDELESMELADRAKL